MDMWHGMVAPAGTPARDRETARRGVREGGTRSPDIERIVAPQATDAFLTTPEEFAKHIAANSERLGKIIRDAGIKAQ